MGLEFDLTSGREATVGQPCFAGSQSFFMLRKRSQKMKSLFLRLSGRAESGRGRPLYGTNVSLEKIRFHWYWTGVW